MRAGELKERLELQAPYRSLNSIGELIDTFTTKDTVWGAIEPLTGKRLFEAKQANADVTGIIRIRYRTGIKPTWRFIQHDRIFRIVSIINPKEDKTELHILYKEGLD